jgi:uncharacterized protein
MQSAQIQDVGPAKFTAQRDRLLRRGLAAGTRTRHASRMRILFIDGWYGPDPGDWQELWLRDLPDAARVGQDDWERPDRDAWVSRMDEAIGECTEPPLLIGHSLGCVALAHWAAVGGGHPVRGAMLAAPADVEAHDEPALRSFAPIPRTPFPFPAVVVASRTDPWMTPQRAREFADAWRASFVDGGEIGHLTVPEYGPWPAGRQILAELAGRTGAGRSTAGRSWL